MGVNVVTRKLLVLLILIVVSLPACDRSPGETLPTQTRMASPVAGIATPSATLTEPIQTIAAVRPTASSTSTPRPTPCGITIQPALDDAWSRLELGCPIAPGATAVQTAYAPFEGGQMLWRGDTDVIYVLYNDGLPQ
jgi:hypothetical protein